MNILYAILWTVAAFTWLLVAGSLYLCYASGWQSDVIGWTMVTSAFSGIVTFNATLSTSGE